MDIEGNKATIDRDIEGGKEVVELQTPFVSVQKEWPSSVFQACGIMMLKETYSGSAPSDSTNATEIVKYEYPAENQVSNLSILKTWKNW